MNFYSLWALRFSFALCDLSFKLKFVLSFDIWLFKLCSWQAKGNQYILLVNKEPWKKKYKERRIKKPLLVAPTKIFLYLIFFMRIWSWSRVNAGGVDKACKSNGRLEVTSGNLAFGLLAIGVIFNNKFSKVLLLFSWSTKKSFFVSSSQYCWRFSKIFW